MKKIFAIVTICFAMPAAAQQSLKCDLQANSPYGWIPSELFVEIDKNEKQATVYAGFIKKYVGKPITTELSGENSKYYKINWFVPNIELTNTRRSVNVDYSARLNKATGKMNVTAYLNGGSDMPPPRGSGTCKPR